MTLADDVPDLVALALAPEAREDPYPAFDALRAAAPVCETSVAVLLSRYADVAAVVRDSRLSNVEPRPETNRAEYDEGVLLFLDPPEHTRMRGLVSKAFTPRTVERLRTRVQQLVNGLLDAVTDRWDGRMDVIAELAYPLPVVVICELLGVPPDDHSTFQGWSRELAASIDPSPLRTPEQEARVHTAATEFGVYFVELIEARRRAPGDDLLSRLIAAEQDGDRLTEQELRNTAMFLLVAGHETTVNLIGNGVLALLHHPDQLARLREHPSLDRRAVEELLRYDSPVQLTQRVTVTDYEVGGVTLPPGRVLIPLLGAANRDPDAFPAPDRLDLTRESAHRHVAFGGGHHFCLGAALARLEAEIAIGTLVRRFPDLQLAAPPTRRETFTLRGLEALPVACSG